MGSNIHDRFLDSRWVPGFTIGKWMLTLAAGASAQDCTGMANWPNTIQCLGSDDIISLGIKSSAFLRVLVLKTVQEFGPIFLDLSCTRRYVKKIFLSGSWSQIVWHVINENCTFPSYRFFKT